MKARNLVVKFQRSYKTKKLSVRRKHLQVAKQRLNEEYNHLEREYLSAQLDEDELVSKTNNSVQA